MTPSLNTRLLLAASVALAAFLGLTGLALDRAFRNSAQAAIEDRLTGQLHGLLAAAELADGGGLELPDTLPEARFDRVNSGLYAQVVDSGGRVIWRSRSLLGNELPLDPPLAPGVKDFSSWEMDGNKLFLYRFGVAWEDTDVRLENFVFSVAEDHHEYLSQVSAFRRSLSLWFGGAVVLLMVVQGAVLRWGLAPLREVAEDIKEIEQGRRSQLTGTYPRELQGLTENINAFLRNELNQSQRYRQSLDDLAHSLKTPLAVLRGAVESKGWDEGTRADIAGEVDRMSEIVGYQLQRAAARNRRTLVVPVALRTHADKVLRSLKKVYLNKSVEVDINVESELMFYGDSGDLMEVLGNLLDNAFKWCVRRVTLSAEPLTDERYRRSGVRLVIGDDGPGIDASLWEPVLKRGVRADQRVGGQGIGLAVVREIVDAYQGELSISPAGASGTQVTVEFPAS
ncbi:MAG: ATP-binding protein [Gammaproteobacteria bacterium]|nr:ATP-binding protein [Gammaproteobacteria bacterium]